MIHYAININGRIYEGSEDFTTAIILYNSVDSTCLFYNDKKTKSLIREEDGERTVIKQNVINIPRKVRTKSEIREYIRYTWGELENIYINLLSTLAATTIEKLADARIDFPDKTEEELENIIDEFDTIAENMLRERAHNFFSLTLQN